MIGTSLFTTINNKFALPNRFKMFSANNFLAKFYYLCMIVITAVCLYNINSTYRNESHFGTKCSLPPHPSFGWWSILSKLTKISGVSTGTILHISCNESYRLEGSNMTICINGKWFPEIGKCLKTCPTMVSTSMLKVRCSYQNKPMEDCDKALDNTRAHFTCAPFYEDERRIKMNAICRNGKWSERMPECVPVCGRRKSRKIGPTIVNGTDAEKGEFPWHVAIYKKGIYICGGTLLHERLVLTAAHCVSDSDGRPESPEGYTVAVGKHYRRYRHPQEDKNFQNSSVYVIFLPENYAGLTTMYSGDIALLVPSKTFELSSTVQPICIDWSQECEDNLLQSHEPVGHVSGWGYTIEYRNYSEGLKNLKLPVVMREKCKEMISDYHEFVTEDKICAGYLNKSRSVCKGDSGSGLIFNHNGRYYIIGIVSIAPIGNTVNGGCNSQELSFYTHVSKYIADFIWEYYARYKPSRSHLVPHLAPTQDNNFEMTKISTSSLISLRRPMLPTTTQNNKKIYDKNKSTGCTLPSHPNFGEWSFFGPSKLNLSPGTLVKSGTILKILCQDTYKLDGDKMVVCENGTWSSAVGTCLKTCPSVYSSEKLNITCFYKYGRLDNCVDPVDGTSAKYHCAPFYEDVKLMEHPLICVDGSWRPRIPICHPKCGQKILEDPIFDNNNSSRKVYPWVVAIYRQKQKKAVCGGSLLTEKLIVTAAECFKNQSEKALSDENYVVAAGQVSSDWQNMQQFSNIERLYRQEEGVAFIVLTNSFQFSLSVQPVCVDWENHLKSTNLEEFMSNWGYFEISSKVVRTKLVSTEECKRHLQKNDWNFETEICVHYNKSDLNTSSCLIDKGGGLFVNHENRYYIVGVMTNLPKTKEDCNQYALFTRIQDYMERMMSEISFDLNLIEGS